MTHDDKVSAIITAREYKWHYDLDDYTKVQLNSLQKVLRKALAEVDRAIATKEATMTAWGRKRALAELNELSKLTLGVQKTITDKIVGAASEAGETAYKEHLGIVGFDGKISGFNNVALSAAQVASVVKKTPVGGKLLEDWVKGSFDLRTRKQIKQEIATGLFKGESYGEMAKRFKEGFVMSSREMETLLRTYVHSANVGAMKDTCKANRDVVGELEWSATLESSYKSTGHGTCLACAALDGERFPISRHPQCPLHPNCRCTLLPVTKTWRELGLDADEIDDMYRTAVHKVDKKVGLMGKEKIIETYKIKGNYSDWFRSQKGEWQEKVLGPGRHGLLKSKALEFKDLVDLKTGRVFTLKELEKRTKKIKKSVDKR